MNNTKIKNVPPDISNDLSGGIPLLLAGFLAFGLVGVVGVVLYEQYAGEPLFSASSGYDVTSYIWLGVIGISILITIIMILKWGAKLK